MCPYTIDFKQDSEILEVGGGDHPLRNSDGNRVTTNMDVREGENIEIVHNLSKFPWPQEVGSYDGIFSRYCLEHLSWRDIKKAIKETHRILRSGGKGIFFLPNTLEQCKLAVAEGINEGASEMLFGSQEFPDNAGVHKCAFSPRYAKELFEKAGFSQVKIIEHPDTITDMIVEVFKMDKNNIFERSYFDSDGDTGYVGTGYRNFPQHFVTARKIVKMYPDAKNILEVGCARGYTVRILENMGLKAFGMDVSKHCFYTRATSSFVLHDLTDIPWAKGRVYGDKSFDVCFSQNVLEHIPEEKIDKVITESVRVSRKGLHGIHYLNSGYTESPDVDKTHCTMKSKSWWEERFKTIAPEYPITIMYPRELENDDVEKCIAYPPKSPDNLVKLNIGSFTDCFYFNWVNIDIIELKGFAQAMGYQFQQHDIEQGIPYADNSVDLIFSSHLIEHLSREEGAKFLKECHQVLKVGGTIRISTPDSELLATEYLNGQVEKYGVINIGVEQAKDKAEAFFNLLMSGHKSIFDEKALTLMLDRAGFKDVKKVSPFKSRSEVIRTQTLTTHPDLSVVLEAQK